MGPRRDGLDTPRAALFAAQATASEPTYAVARSGRGSRVRRFGGPALCRTAGCGDLRWQPDGQARIRTHAGAGAAESKELRSNWESPGHVRSKAGCPGPF